MTGGFIPSNTGQPLAQANLYAQPDQTAFPNTTIQMFADIPGAASFSEITLSPTMPSYTGVGPLSGRLQSIAHLVKQPTFMRVIDYPHVRRLEVACGIGYGAQIGVPIPLLTQGGRAFRLKGVIESNHELWRYFMDDRLFNQAQWRGLTSPSKELAQADPFILAFPSQIGPNFRVKVAAQPGTAMLPPNLGLSGATLSAFPAAITAAPTGENRSAASAQPFLTAVGPSSITFKSSTPNSTNDVDGAVRAIAAEVARYNANLPEPERLRFGNSPALNGSTPSAQDEPPQFTGQILPSVRNIGPEAIRRINTEVHRYNSKRPMGQKMDFLGVANSTNAHSGPVYDHKSTPNLSSTNQATASGAATPKASLDVHERYLRYLEGEDPDPRELRALSRYGDRLRQQDAAGRQNGRSEQNDNGVGRASNHRRRPRPDLAQVSSTAETGRASFPRRMRRGHGSSEDAVMEDAQDDEEQNEEDDLPGEAS